MKRFICTVLVLLGMISFNTFAGTYMGGFTSGIYTPPPDAKYTYDANASFGVIKGTYWADWNKMRYICTDLQRPVVKEWTSNSNGYYQEWIWPDGWFFSTLWNAQQANDLRYDSFYAHPPGETNVFRCANTEQGLSNFGYHFLSVGGNLYYCTSLMNKLSITRKVILTDTCNGSTCLVLDKFFNSTTAGCGVVKPPEPEPQIVNNPCPTNSAIPTAGHRMADSTSISGQLPCVNQINVGFDSQGNAKSVVIEQYNQVRDTVNSTLAAPVAAAKGGSDSTSIGAIPTTANYSSATLGQNANGQTQLKGWSSGTQTVQ